MKEIKIKWGLHQNSLNDKPIAWIVMCVYSVHLKTCRISVRGYSIRRINFLLR